MQQFHCLNEVNGKLHVEIAENQKKNYKNGNGHKPFDKSFISKIGKSNGN